MTTPTPTHSVIVDSVTTSTSALKQLKIPGYQSDPLNPRIVGSLIFNTDDQDVKVSNGEEWLTVGGSGGKCCASTTIKPNQLGATGYVIANPGNYTLGGSIVWTNATNPAIRILASNVNLDLCGLTIDLQNTGFCGVLVDATSAPRTGVSVTNGIIRNLASTTVSGIDACGVALVGSSPTNAIGASTVSNLILLGGRIGLYGQYCSARLTHLRVAFQTATDTYARGLYLQLSSCIEISGCSISNITTTGTSALTFAASQAAGLYMNLVQTVTLSNNVICSVSGPIASGFVADNSSNLEYSDNSVSGINGVISAAGYVAGSLTADFTPLSCDFVSYTRCSSDLCHTDSTVLPSDGSVPVIVAGFHSAFSSHITYQSCRAEDMLAANMPQLTSVAGCFGFFGVLGGDGSPAEVPGAHVQVLDCLITKVRSEKRYTSASDPINNVYDANAIEMFCIIPSFAPTVSVGTQDVTVKGCTISNVSSKSSATGIFLGFCNGFIVEDCSVCDVSASGHNHSGATLYLDFFVANGVTKNCTGSNAVSDAHSYWLSCFGLGGDQLGTLTPIHNVTFVDCHSSNVINTVAAVTNDDSACGFELEDLNGVIVERCSSNGCIGTVASMGFLADSVRGLVMKDCWCTNNIGTTANANNVAFMWVGTSPGGVVENCSASFVYNTAVAALSCAAFKLTGTAATDIQLRNCAANLVQGTFPGVGNGFELTTTSARCLVQGCRASSCIGSGFLNAGPATNKFYDNTATSNAVNFSGIANTAAPGAATTLGVNIDG